MANEEDDDFNPFEDRADARSGSGPPSGGPEIGPKPGPNFETGTPGDPKADPAADNEGNEWPKLHLVDEVDKVAHEVKVVPWMAKDWVPTVESVREAFIGDEDKHRKRGSDFLVSTDGRSFWWNGYCWQWDEREHHLREAIGNFCVQIGYDIGKTKIKKQLETGGFVSAVKQRFMDRNNIPVDAFDRADLINVRSGTLRGELLGPHRRADHLTRSTSIAPKPGPCPLTDAFFDKIFGGDPELIAYVWRMLGYCLTGATNEQVLFFCWGEGRNGKSVFVDMTSDIFGSYSATIDMELLMSARTPITDLQQALARLVGVRLVTAVETSHGHWDEGRIKRLTGGDRLTARHLYCQIFEYFPQFKLILIGNEKPGLYDVSFAIRRRLQLVPFLIVIADEEDDKQLRAKLRAEYPQVLHKILDYGLREYRRIGLAPPPAVTKATEEMMEELDFLGQWIEANCWTDRPEAKQGTSHLFRDYEKFVKGLGERPLSHRKFSIALKARGFVHSHDRTGNWFEGIELRQTRQQREPGPDNPSTGDMLSGSERPEDFR